MFYQIKLPGGPHTFYSKNGWYCPDPKAIPMLNYFTKEVMLAHPAYSEEEMVRAVAATIAGCEFIAAQPDDPNAAT